MTIKNTEIKTFDNSVKASFEASIDVSEAISGKEPVVCLATGSTPIQLYKELIKKYESGEDSWDNVKTFNLDEYIGLAPTSKFSFRYFMNENLFKHINLKEDNINFLSGTSKNTEEEIQRYEDEMDKAGNFDITILGVGTNGHIGFNEPGTDIKSKTHSIKLTESTIESNKVYFDDPSEMPVEALTMGIDTIISRSKKIILLAFGETKRDAIESLIKGKVDKNSPITTLLDHKNVIIYTDLEL